MQIMIDISEEDYNIMRHNIAVNNPLCPLSQEEMVSKVANGIPLPKGHGRLIDESAITEVYTDETEPVKINGMTVIPTRIVIAGTNAPTIIEADKEESEVDEE